MSSAQVECMSLLPSEGKQSESKSSGYQHDVEELSAKIQRLMSVLQRMPRDGGASSGGNTHNGKLKKKGKNSLMLGKFNEWKEMFFTLEGCSLRFSKSFGKKGKTIPISFCSVDRLEYTKEEVARLPEGYAAQVEAGLLCYRFRVYSKNQIYFLEANNEVDLQEWISAISHNLEQVLGEDELEAKTIAARNLEPLLKAQAAVEYEQYRVLMSNLQDWGFGGGGGESTHMIASPDKLKEGYVHVMKKGDPSAEGSGWKRCYFVLVHQTLYYYKNSHDEQPTGVLTLRCANVSLPKKQIKKATWIIKIETPLRTHYLRFKHEASLSNWLTKIDEARGLGESSLSKDFGDMVVTPKWKKNSDFFKDRRGRHAFKKFLDKEDRDGKQELNLFKFKRDVEDLKKVAEAEDNVTSSAKKLYEKYLSSNGERYLPKLREYAGACSKGIAQGDADSAFDKAYKEAKRILCEEHLPNFKKSKYFDDLVRETANAADMAVPIVGPKYLKIYESSDTKTVMLKLGPNTIGRDSSCDITLKDGKVSRSHGVFTVDKQDRVLYSDSGSTAGSKLNLAKCTKAGLREGDIISIGHTEIHIISSNGASKK